MYRDSQRGTFLSRAVLASSGRNGMEETKKDLPPATSSTAQEETKSKEDQQRQEDINVYIAMGCILLITVLVVFVKVSSQNIFLTDDEDNSL